ncbi:MAG: carotenoid biosynthesis protein [candidate division KSB1 bacterium]|nr:carotenoid biosynthesis protein [candidate division KSB1 bacterium]MDZ7304016.1 carotenoid biosynthesis protein [candidate division KSB1 bacterium]MDZ7313274.1 carotenoid biosynthesis protein [candidate division KSB1 bacterium]
MSIPRQYFVIVVLYVLLVAGGVWHLLGVLQTEMRQLAAPMITLLSLVLGFAHFRHLQNNETQRVLKKYLSWTAFVLAGSFFIELAGVKSGVIFGVYAYGDTLQPTLWEVPLAIGFAWLTMVLSATATAQRMIGPRLARAPWLTALSVAFFMVIFDFFMEPAAMKLGYWNWHHGTVPWRNYFAWFVFGCFFSYTGLRLRLFTSGIPAVATHAYLAQLLYFIMVNLS